jgi:hypothetical protein
VCVCVCVCRVLKKLLEIREGAPRDNSETKSRISALLRAR